MPPTARRCGGRDARRPEEQRRLAASIERRRSAPDEGPGAVRGAPSSRLSAAACVRSSNGPSASGLCARRRSSQSRQAATRRDAELAPCDRLLEVIGELEQVGEAIDSRRSEFEAALAADREAGEHVAAELRTCAQQEAGLQNRLHAASESPPRWRFGAQRTADQAEDATETLERVAGELALEATPAREPLDPPMNAAVWRRASRAARQAPGAARAGEPAGRAGVRRGAGSR